MTLCNCNCFCINCKCRNGKCDNCGCNNGRVYFAIASRIIKCHVCGLKHTYPPCPEQ